MQSLLTELDYSIADRCKADSYYLLPREVECFIERANKELPEGYYVLPYTLGMSVSLFRYGIYIASVSYEAIESDIVACLDLLHEFFEQRKTA